MIIIVYYFFMLHVLEYVYFIQPEFSLLYFIYIAFF